MELEIHPVVIIGSGPAAWTAALYTARANLKPLVFEGEFSKDIFPGGQLMTTLEVENFPGFPEGILGPELVERIKRQAERFGVFTRAETITKVDFSQQHFVLYSSTGTKVYTPAVIIATGATAKRLGVPGEDALAQGGGVSYCAVCDGALPAYRDKPLVVIGGGDSAMEEALYLTKFASEVTLIHRRDKFRASRVMVNRVLSHPKINVTLNKRVVEILGDTTVSGVLVEDTQTYERSLISTNGVFVAIGHTPNTNFLEGQVALDSNGYIITNRTATSIPGVFAAGDVADPHYRQAITASASGCMAALEAERWLTNRHEALLRKLKR